MDADSLALVFAVVFTAVGLVGFVRLYLVASGWATARGEVVASHRRLDTRWGNARYAHFATIAFRAADGKDYEVVGDYGRGQPWQIGERVELSYDAANPDKATNLPRWQRLALPGVFVGFAALCWAAWLG